MAPSSQARVRPSLRLWGTALGMLLGVAYAVSPLTVWFVIAMIGVFWWAGLGLGERERRFVWGILAVALAIRVVAIAALFLVSYRHLIVSFFWDGDGTYLKQRALVIRNVWVGVPVSPIDFSTAFYRAYGWSTYLYVLAYVQYLIGPAPYAIHLFNVTMFVATVVMMHRLVRTAYGRLPALLGMALVLFLPTLISWSVSALKESLYVFLCAVGLMGAIAAVRAKRLWERAVGVALLAGATAANGTVRAGASLIMMAGIASGIAGSIVVRRVALVLLVLTLLPFVAVRAWENAGVQARIMSQLRTSAVIHTGNVRTEGHGYKLLDQRIYSDNAPDTMTPTEGLRFVVRALASFVFVPLPWQVESRSEIVFLAQHVIWYILVVLAFVGLVAGLRRDALVTCMLAGISATGGAAIALNSGNIGTLVRFRDTIVPFVVWLSALGAVATASTVVSRASFSKRRAKGKDQQATTIVEAASV